MTLTNDSTGAPNISVALRPKFLTLHWGLVSTAAQTEYPLQWEASDIPDSLAQRALACIAS